MPYETRCKTGRCSPKVCATKSRLNFLHECTQSTPLDPKLTFWCVSYYLGAFGTFGCLTKLDAKWAELVQKFVPRSRVRIFHNECIRSTTLHRKLMFWCVLFYLDAFGTVWLPYETRSKTGRTSPKARETKSHRNFSTTNAPDPPHWTQN